MTKINIISGFLGAGKTTLIKKLLGGAFEGEKVVLLENEYGEVGIDGGFMKDSGIQVTELNSGCICCTLVGDFNKALIELIETYSPDRILIEPSGVGKLSDIRGVVHEVSEKCDVQLAGCATVADVNKCRMYAKNFGEFFLDQIESTETIILSRTQNVSQDRLDKCVALLRGYNEKARIVTTPWDDLDAAKLLETIETPESLLDIKDICPTCGHSHHDHEHHHHDHDECECGHDHEHEHHHDHDHDEHDHEHHDEHDHEHHDEHDHEHHDEHHDEHHHHHDHDHEHDDHEHHHHEHEHHHDHDHDDHDHHHEHGCSCGCDHDHDHHGHHHADEVFENIGVETAKKFDEAQLRAAIEELDDEDRFGAILRAKGILQLTDGSWLHFDYVPGEYEIRKGAADYTGRLCVIGVGLEEAELKELFGI